VYISYAKFESILEIGSEMDHIFLVEGLGEFICRFVRPTCSSAAITWSTIDEMVVRPFFFFCTNAFHLSAAPGVLHIGGLLCTGNNANTIFHNTCK